VTNLQPLFERMIRHRDTAASEQAEIERLRNVGAYKYGHKNPRGREIAKQIKQAEGRLRTAKRRAEAARQAILSAGGQPDPAVEASVDVFGALSPRTDVPEGEGKARVTERAVKS
jgi:hypothetical protein